MIVVIGSAQLRVVDGRRSAGGLAVDIAGAAAAAGSRVEFIGRIGDDDVGDELLVALSRLGVGHVATLRDAAHPTAISLDEDDVAGDDGSGPPADPADARTEHRLDREDVDLALRYLTDFAVVVAVGAGADMIGELGAAVAWASARLIVVDGDSSPDVLPPDTLVIAVDDHGGESAVGAAIGRYAATIDRNEDPAGAYASILAAAGRA